MHPRIQLSSYTPFPDLPRVHFPRSMPQYSQRFSYQRKLGPTSKECAAVFWLFVLTCKEREWCEVFAKRPGSFGEHVPLSKNLSQNLSQGTACACRICGTYRKRPQVQPLAELTMPQSKFRKSISAMVPTCPHWITERCIDNKCDVIQRVWVPPRFVLPRVQRLEMLTLECASHWKPDCDWKESCLNYI